MIEVRLGLKRVQLIFRQGLNLGAKIRAFAGLLFLSAIATSTLAASAVSETPMVPADSFTAPLDRSVRSNTDSGNDIADFDDDSALTPEEIKAFDSLSLEARSALETTVGQTSIDARASLSELRAKLAEFRDRAAHLDEKSSFEVGLMQKYGIHPKGVTMMSAGAAVGAAAVMASRLGKVELIPEKKKKKKKNKGKTTEATATEE